eukprot:TRINITY_DN4851_c0_g1_i1.p1 TRINITY_DN4851_c0_g1~~TRINITY_DN4851_c0_g1_i1.p1  ORF type:complete len:488 (-),score=104.73 TRINITY_DN4851_c0_g1_i1:6-1469(-)
MGTSGLLLLLLVGLVASQTAPTYSTHWFDQRVDHFNNQNAQTWKQRYLISDLNWAKPQQGALTGPIFFYTGNEGDILEFYNNTGFIFESAPIYGALVVFAEHRYYGESWPFGTAEESFKPQNIGYLSVEQALADYANLLTSLKIQLNAKDVPVISFGGSYGGMLTAWLRIKYPNVVAGAIAASAPILFFSEGPDFQSPPPTFFETVTNDFNQVNPACPVIVRQAFSEILSLAEQGPSGLQTLTETFNVCPPLRSKEDVDLLILWITNAFGTMAMVDYPYPASFLGSLPAWPIKVACDLLIKNAYKPMSALAAANALLYNATQNLQCFNVSEEFVFCADQTGCGTGPAGISWDYQACSEIIYCPTTNNVTDMFPPRKWDLADLTDYCQKTFGIKPRPDWLSIYTGGANIRAASNIVFSNGMLDPWHGGGFLESVSPTLTAVRIELGAHHLDLRFSNPADPISVITARKIELEHITVWIAQHRAQNAKQ